MTQTEAAYPLQWPAAWPRTKAGWHEDGVRFGRNWTIERARRELAWQLDKLGAEDAVLSSNLALRIDGQPRGGQSKPSDNGVAVYFTLKGRRLVLACDKWTKIEHNLRAIAAHVDALRGIERWGVGSVEQAFLGYAALPANGSSSSWLDELGFHPGDTIDETAIDRRFRELVKVRHPDHGGDVRAFQRLNDARTDALASLNT